MSEARKALVAGIMIGEAGTTCATVRGLHYPTLFVSMCDRKAVEIVAQGWGERRIHKGGKGECPPTPDNPEGRTHVVRAHSHPANDIIQAYKHHLEGTQLLTKWETLLKRCPLPKKRLRPKP